MILSPGEACRSPVPGFFRIVFAWVSLEAQQEGVKRMIRAIVRKNSKKIK